MRNGFALLVAGALFLSPMLVESLLGQQQGGAQPPAASRAAGRCAGRGRRLPGRQGGGGRAAAAAVGGGGRAAAGPPPAPAPRNAAGRVIFSSGNPKEPVLWTASLGITGHAAASRPGAVPAVGEGAVRRP